MLSYSEQALVHAVADVQQRTVQRLSLDVWPNVRPSSSVWHWENGGPVINVGQLFWWSMCVIPALEAFLDVVVVKWAAVANSCSQIGDWTDRTDHKDEGRFCGSCTDGEHACLIRVEVNYQQPTSSFFEISPVLCRRKPCTIFSDLTRTISFSS